MKSRSILTCGLAGILIMSACSSSEEKPKLKSAANTNSVNANTVHVDTGTQVSQPQIADANVNTGLTTSADELGLAANRTDVRLQTMRKTGDAGADLNAEQIAMRNARPAPDNSTFTSYLTDAGYEIRTFRDHPQLARAEKKITPDGKQSLKIYLRDGKVVELPGERITVLATATAAYILEAAGIKPQPPKAAPVSGPPVTKKSGE